jgi:hypothetical protein
MGAIKHTYLAFGEKHLDDYKKLGESLGKPTNKDQFMLAMSWGFRNGTRVEDFRRSGNGARIDYLKEEDLALIAAVHLATSGDPNALSSVDDGFTIAEQYAEGGILLLRKMMDEPGDFSRKLAGEVKAEVDRLGINVG